MIVIIFYRNSEANASEFLENIEVTLSLYYMDSGVCNRLNYLTAQFLTIMLHGIST